jgi:hypothetical protein
MKVYRKKILILCITAIGVFGLLNVSVQFGKIIDFFPGISLSLLLAEEITETEGSEKGSESFSEIELFLTKGSFTIQNSIVDDSVEVYLHSVDLPAHPAFDKVVPPPKA